MQTSKQDRAMCKPSCSVLQCPGSTTDAETDRTPVQLHTAPRQDLHNDNV